MKKEAIIISSLLLAISGNFHSKSLALEDEEKKPDYIMDTSGIGNSENGVLRSEQLLELGSLTPGALSIEGEQSLRQGSLDRALTVLQRSVELAPLDMDVRILYAQTLEKKLAMYRGKNKKDLKNFIVKQWLFVYRKAEFFDQKMLALNSIYTFTGAKPKRFENDAKFLARAKKVESLKVAEKAKDSKQPENHSNPDLDTELVESKQPLF